MYSQIWAVITTISFRAFSPPQKETPSSLATHSPTTPLPIPKQLLTFFLCRLPFLGHFIQTEWHHICYFCACQHLLAHLFAFSHSSECEVVLCGFDLHVPSDWCCWVSIFSCTYWPFVYLSCRSDYCIPLPILKLAYLSFYNCVVRRCLGFKMS